MSSRKKHTHQTKAEAHAEQEALAPEAAQTPPPEPADAKEGFQRALRMAKKRLHGTRAELLLDGLPARLEKALDAALDRVGLVRKSKLPGARATTAPVDAQLA